jgi:hypothetical protein
LADAVAAIIWRPRSASRHVARQRENTCAPLQQQFLHTEVAKNRTRG